MKQFIDDIITRISDYFKSDSDIAKVVKVDYANKQGDTINPPHITVQQMDDSNAEEYDTFSVDDLCATNEDRKCCKVSARECFHYGRQGYKTV